MLKAAGYAAPGIWTEFRLASWGLLIGLVVVVAAAAIAVRPPGPRRRAAARRHRRMTVHLLELPMTSDRATGASPEHGTWFALACVVALVLGRVALGPTKAKTGELAEQPAGTPTPRRAHHRAGEEAKTDVRDLTDAACRPNTQVARVFCVPNPTESSRRYRRPS